MTVITKLATNENAEADSILGLLSLGVTNGEEIEVSIEGNDPGAVDLASSVYSLVSEEHDW